MKLWTVVLETATPEMALRAVGGSLIVLSLAHGVIGKALDWPAEAARMSPLNARVFHVHSFFVAYILMLLGLLSLVRPELLLIPSDLGTLLVGGIVVFWLLRLGMQPLVFDAFMRAGWTRSPIIRGGSVLLWVTYVGVYGLALVVQLGGAGARQGSTGP